VAENPEDPFARDNLVWAYYRLTGYTQRDESLVLLDDAITIGERLVREYPSSAEFRRELANVLAVKMSVMLGPSPSPQTLAEAISIERRSLALTTAILADLKSKGIEALQPQRPKSDLGRLFSASPMWAEFDVAEHSADIAILYRLQSDWGHAAEMFDQSVSSYKDVVEHSPSVATFNGSLDSAFADRVAAAKHNGDPKQVAAWSKDAVAYWNRLSELYPDLPALKTYADEAMKRDAEVAKWLVGENAESKQP
jgi:tetratricopeptide (TPR) repeat protein